MLKIDGRLAAAMQFFVFFSGQAHFLAQSCERAAFNLGEFKQNDPSN